MFRNRIDDFLQAAAYVLYSGWRNVHSMGWNVRSTAWNIRSSPWNIKFIRLLRETKCSFVEKVDYFKSYS
ncbi:hypothetical protein Bacsa_0598 [Phocaeicola salanitronis DSM 18170]|uniref:Uncharacterized protein n=1 Tax=Phocaeicola salanitronis (strain DSM 18170 / JCM 13657 / CCUG 60908 / BL78) TaxID=667015 RepID=F0R029_PHOSB|nr:hypothetical protein Bacsa_0598 [Phocaeicola salanitronis DSM 18170]